MADVSLHALDLLHPELFTKDVLTRILTQRGVIDAKGSSLCREELLKLYYQHVVPQPQRKFYSNMRWAQRVLQRRLRTASPCASASASDPNSRSNERAGGKRSSIVFDGAITCTSIKLRRNDAIPTTPAGNGTVKSPLPVTDRLKPPPVANFSGTVIKLSNTGSTPVAQLLPSTNRNGQAKDASPCATSKAVVTAIKRIASPKVPVCSTASQKGSDMMDNMSPEPKKKIQKIKWP
uniref:Ashwin n=1 Tax=Eptatretus burgeri TaxID=7764 RepID=A0A8C4R3K7_EPTBU